jgi:hypothetical protein
MPSASPPIAHPRRLTPRLQRYGRYVLVDRLGAGGMAEVFRAVAIGPEQFQRVVVVKRILPHLTENPSFVRMFIDEATLCGRLSHPNIIQVYEFGREEGSYFIAMEYVEGRNLATLLGQLSERGETVPVNVTADIVRQACLGLGYAHALAGSDGKPLHIIHRDVTPSNIMISYAGAVKILDFGIARVANMARISSTDAGQVKGKSSYLAPEQVRGAPFDHRVDIFSTGIVLHEALTGRRLFKGANPVHTLELIEHLRIPAPSRLNPAVPARLDQIVVRALARDPAARYQSALDMAEELEEFLLERRHSSQEVTRFMRGLFGEEMAADAVLPQEEIHALASAPVPLADRTPAVAVTTELTPDPDLARPVAPTWSAPAPRAGTRWWVLTALAAGGALLMGATVSGLLRPAPKVPVVVTAPVAEPEMVKLSFSSDPPEAEVYRSSTSEPIGRTPLTIAIPRGDAPIDLRISKHGYVPGLLTVVPNQDRATLVTLARLPEPVPAGDGAHRPATRPRPGKIRDAVPIDPFAP